MKKIIAACIDKIIDFDTPEEAAAYLENLRGNGKEFRFVDREEVNSKYRMHVQEQYNKTPLID